MAHASSDGIQLHYEVHDETGGRGEAVLCIMGLGGASNWWYPQVDGLRHRYRLITFDNRGLGRSERAPGPYTMSQMARDALAVLDAEGVERAHVMGISMGGMVAQHFALDFPERLQKLVLVCTHAGGPGSVQPSQEVLGALMANAGAAAAPLAERIDRLGWILFPRAYLAEARDELIADLSARAPEPAPAETFMAQLMAIVSHHTEPRLGQIRHPTLVLTGDEDVLVPPRNSEILARGIPGAKLVTLPGAGHGLNVQQPEAFNLEVAAFLG